MNTSSAKIFKIFFRSLLVFALSAFLLSKMDFIKIFPLRGAITKPDKAHLSFKNWFSGDYQVQEEKYLNETFGLRSIFIRIHNQISFSLFHKANALGVIVGKKNYLYELNYIRAYYGQDYIGFDSVCHRMQRLKYVQDTLTKLNKTLIVIFAAGKGSFYPEYFPDNYKDFRRITNYETQVMLAKALRINFIDFNRYFIENKYKSKYPLYPQYGVHWSNYGMCIVADSLIRYIEKKRNIDMPNFCYNDVKFDKPKDGDDDIVQGMNIIFCRKNMKMAYPHHYIESDSGKTKPSILVISDSFYWGIYNFGFSAAFSDSHFWYYHEQLYPESFQPDFNSSQINLKELLAKQDVIVIMGSEGTMSKFGWGFIEDAYNLFKSK